MSSGFSLRENFDPFGTSLLEYSAYRDQALSFASSGAGIERSFNLIGGAEPERLQGAAVMADFLDTLGVKPVLGRRNQGRSDGGPQTGIEEAIARIGSIRMPV